MRDTHVFPSGGWVIFNPESDHATFSTDDGTQLVRVDVGELMTWVLSLPVTVFDRVMLSAPGTGTSASDAGAVAGGAGR